MAAPLTAPPSDPLPLVLIVLSGVTGLVDAISILGMGKVFTANMTGNVVFLGFAFGGASGYEMPRYIAALLAFLAGAWVGGLVANAFHGSTHRRWLLTVAPMEAGLFWVAAIVAIGYDAEHLRPVTHLYALIALTALAMGLRNATVRRLNVPDLTTTVLTLTLTGLAADSHFAGGTDKNWRRRIGAVLAIFVGAVIGAMLVLEMGLVLPLILCGLIVVLATAIYALGSASELIVP
jgi:uncharacterized membrane protein YoaK (UPF0700 family)